MSDEDITTKQDDSGFTDNCKSCGVAWENHDGVERTCHKLQVAIKALKYCASHNYSITARKALEVILGN